MALFDRLHGARTSKQISGDAAEDAALAFLLQQGLHEVRRNFRCKGGEIDLIMCDDDVVVFVEVRKRSKDSYGGALASVTRAKQKRLIIAAQVFLQNYRRSPACRFDVLAYDGDRLTWLKNAVEIY
ncbi:MAG: YraN family protein [Herbaspirillum sp.]